MLFALHPKFNLLDFAGPLEVLTSSQHDVNDACKCFESHFCLRLWPSNSTSYPSALPTALCYVFSEEGGLPCCTSCIIDSDQFISYEIVTLTYPTLL